MQTVLPSLFPKIALSFFALFMIVAMATIVIMYLRKELVSISRNDKNKRTSMDNAFVLAGYDTVVKKVKEQEREIERLRKSEKDSKASAGRLTDSLLQAMNAGFVQFNQLAIICSADVRSRALLGYASPTGMHARDIFKGITTTTSIDTLIIVNAVQNAAKAGSNSNTFYAIYCTPSGEQKKLHITVFPLSGNTLEASGAGCILTEPVQDENPRSIKVSL
jgi:hypothetical protein